MHQFKCYKVTEAGEVHILPWAGLSCYLLLLAHSELWLEKSCPFYKTSSASCSQSHPLKPGILTELREGKEIPLPPRK